MPDPLGMLKQFIRLCPDCKRYEISEDAPCPKCGTIMPMPTAKSGIDEEMGARVEGLRKKIQEIYRVDPQDLIDQAARSLTATAAKKGVPHA